MSDSTANTPEERGERLPAMGFMQHLEELRRRLLISIYSVLAAMCVCLYWQKDIFRWAMRPVTRALAENHLDTHLTYTNPTDPMNIYIEMALIAGIFVASPVILYQVWAYIRPALYKNERRWVIPFMVSTVGLFILGGWFGYTIAFPPALKFLIGFGDEFKPMITIHEYSNLFLKMILGLGVVFELPILLVFLALFGIVSPKWLLKNTRYAILGIFILAGMLTPTPDVLNMCIFAAPLLALYFVSIFFVWLVHPKTRERRKEKTNA